MLADRLPLNNLFWCLLMATLTVIMAISCTVKKLPSTRLHPHKSEISTKYVGDSLLVKIKNTVNAPFRFYLNSDVDETNRIISQHNPIVLSGLADTIMQIPISKTLQSPFRMEAKYGDPSLPTKKPELIFPIPVNRNYRIVQGNNSNPGHNHLGSRYALDFSHKVNDTICSASNGYVIGLIDGYSEGGSNKRWKPYSNFLLIYDDVSNLFFMYGHLTYNSSLVSIGDTVKMGEPIALAGITGYTLSEHLHFDCYRADESSNGFSSTPYTFLNGTTSQSLRRGTIVSRK